MSWASSIWLYWLRVINYYLRRGEMKRAMQIYSLDPHVTDKMKRGVRAPRPIVKEQVMLAVSALNILNQNQGRNFSYKFVDPGTMVCFEVSVRDLTSVSDSEANIYLRKVLQQIAAGVVNPNEMATEALRECGYLRLASK